MIKNCGVLEKWETILKKLAIKMRLFNKAKKYAAILSELRRNLCLTKNPFETNGNLTVTIVTC